MGAEIGMLVVETIAKIRRAYFVHGQPIKAICRDLGVSRKVVRKVIRSEATEFRYEREAQPLLPSVQRCRAGANSFGLGESSIGLRTTTPAKRSGAQFASRNTSSWGVQTRDAVPKPPPRGGPKKVVPAGFPARSRSKIATIGRNVLEPEK